MSVGNLTDVAENIRLGEKGIFFSANRKEVSFPEEGSDTNFLLEANSFWFRHRNNIISTAIGNFSPGSTFFDIGGGTGFVTKHLQDQGVDTVLVEPSEAGAIHAKSRGVRQVVCSTLEDAGFKARSIESCGLFDVVEHIEHDVQFLAEINHYLSDSGYAYFTVPAYNFLWSYEDDYAGHFRRYTLTSFEQVLLKAGMKVVYSTYIFSFLPIPVFIFRGIPYRLNLKNNTGNTEKYQREHRPPSGISNAVLTDMLDWEIGRVRQKKRIPVGGSCFVVAQPLNRK